ncbi:hypothetical protein ACFYNO_31870 [Kitasatospora sp. NPDC006697]|uniref:hypothetical protein n=1 Tax=Kitasatospora sp. NPDC006697 TaxID=3364020 RepID=UPI003676242A
MGSGARAVVERGFDGLAARLGFRPLCEDVMDGNPVLVPALDRREPDGSGHRP